MKNSILCLATLFFVTSAQAATTGHDASEKFALGLMAGSLMSATGKYWLSPRGALDFGLGVGGYRGVAIYADYLWHIPGIFGSGSKFGRETFGYFGGGGGLGSWSDSSECGRWKCNRRTSDSGTGVFLRGFFGFEWFPLRTRFGVFAEAGPTLLLTPSTSVSPDLGVGGRYYF